MEENCKSRERLKELEKMKRVLLTRMSRHRKELAKCKVRKRAINEEIFRIKSNPGVFDGMTSQQAFSAVATAIRDTKPEDMYPKDLEKEFDKIEKSLRGPNDRVTEIDDTDDDGVIDMSDEGGEEEIREPAGEEDDL